MSLFKKTKKNLIRLPTTPLEFDDLVELVCYEFGLTDKRHAAAVISVAIRHLKPEEYKATVEYFGGHVIKALANHVANFKSLNIQHDVQIDQLVEKYKQDPLDAQARDELVKAAGEGSESAKKAVKELNLEPPDLKVVPASRETNEEESLRDPGIQTT